MTDYAVTYNVDYVGDDADGESRRSRSGSLLPSILTARNLGALRLGGVSRVFAGALMSTLELFLPLTKVDVDARMVHGVATAESPDRAGEICDYETTKPYFQSWSARHAHAVERRQIAGRGARHARTDRGGKAHRHFLRRRQQDAFSFAAKIVDDSEWEKVLEGVYTGFSQGGRYVKRWSDEATGMTRYTAEPTEISLVDVPCLPGATFEVVKGGVIEKRAFAAPSCFPPIASACGAAAASRGVAGFLYGSAGEGRARHRERGRQIAEGDGRECPVCARRWVL